MQTNHSRKLLALAAAALCAASVQLHAAGYAFRVVATGLARPTGLVIKGNNEIYFTEVPTPGVGGGANAVKKLNLESGVITTLHMGEPEPTNIALDTAGNLYWTCKSAGVILEQSADGSTTTHLLTGLSKPSGIALDRFGQVYFTEIPLPGGTQNRVSIFNRDGIKILHMGEPEPTDIGVNREGVRYWTCKSAGVILVQSNDGLTTSHLLSGLDHPVGIALDAAGRNLYWTEVPTPGVPGSAGGSNKVMQFDLATSTTKIVHAGDPEPTDITVAANGRLYWTCSSAGVIVEARPVR